MENCDNVPVNLKLDSKPSLSVWYLHTLLYIRMCVFTYVCVCVYVNGFMFDEDQVFVRVLIFNNQKQKLCRKEDQRWSLSLFDCIEDPFILPIYSFYFVEKKNRDLIRIFYVNGLPSRSVVNKQIKVNFHVYRIVVFFSYGVFVSVRNCLLQYFFL